MTFGFALKSILVGIPIGITFFDSVCYVARVEGISMQPALNPEDSVTDYVLLNRWAVRTYELCRGNVICLVSPKDPDQKIIKRIVGLEGDIIKTLGYKKPFVRVPEGHCWVEGDHTGHSLDSNTFGPVSLGLITAKASLIVWPPHRWRNLGQEVPIDHIEFQSTGNVFPNAMALGDVTNDGEYELIVGNTNGELTIFKGDKVWQTFTKLGMITAVGIGDVFNCGQNAVVVVGGDGWCKILSNSKVPFCKNVEQASYLEVIHTQRIPANTKVVLLGDVDGDGHVELVLGLTDRVVRSYRWVHQDSSGTSTGTDKFSNSPKVTIGSHIFVGKLLGLNKWECASQIGSVTINHSADGTPYLLVAQPGGTLMKIRCQEPDNGERELTSNCIEYHPLSQSHMRNPNVSTEILGDIQPPDYVHSKNKGMRYAVATLDGTLMLVEDEEILWSIQVDHQLFALTKLRILEGNDTLGENIVACSWDGQTYILDQEKQSVRFQLEESVRAFCAGYYSTEANKNPSPCLVYTTFTNKIYIYYNVRLPSMVTKRLTPKVNFGFDASTTEGRKKVKELTEWLLYGVTEEQ